MTQEHGNEKEFELEQADFNVLHDVVLGVTGKKLSNDALKLTWLALPENLKEDAIHWGLNDTVVRDNIYEHLMKIYE